MDSKTFCLEFVQEHHDEFLRSLNQLVSVCDEFGYTNIIFVRLECFLVIHGDLGIERTQLEEYSKTLESFEVLLRGDTSEDTEECLTRLFVDGWEVFDDELEDKMVHSLVPLQLHH